MPVSSDHDFFAEAARYSRAIGWAGTVLAAASMKPRTMSSGGAPGAGESGSMPTSSDGRTGASVICTVGELAGTVEQAERASARTTSSADSRQGPADPQVTTAPADGGRTQVAAAAASW